MNSVPVRVAVLCVVVLLGSVIGGKLALAQAPQAFVVDVQPRKPTTPLASGIVRGGAEQKALMWEPLYPGDRVFARGTGAQIVIQLKFDKITIDASKAPYEIKGDSDWLAYMMPSFVSNMRWSNSQQLDAALKPSDSIGRGDAKEPLSLLPNVRDPVKFTQSGPPLWLGWRGGVPPFKLSVASGGTEIAAAQICRASKPDDCSREAVFEKLSQLPAEFEISVADASGATIVRHAKVETTAGPPAGDQHAPDFQQFAAIVDIVDSGGGRAWALEAGRRLVPLANNFPPARAMLDGLRDGILP